MTTLKYGNLNERLFQWLPELRPAYREKFDWWGDEEPGPHVVYGDVLTPHMSSLLMSGDADQDAEQLKRIFGLLEEMSTSTDERVREVVIVTICEYLVDRKVPYERAKPFMGTQTRELCSGVET